jgi:hypothetical protein
MAAEHMWVSFTYTPLIVEPQDNGSLKISANDSAIETAVDEAMMGCWFCYTPLTVDSFNTECTHESTPPN